MTSYKIYRDGTSQYQTVAGADDQLRRHGDAAGSSHTYAVSAVDGAGNESARSDPVTVTTTSSDAGVPDGFEGGNLKAWSSSGGLTVQSTTVRTGQYAALGSSNTVGNYAKRTLPAGYTDGYARTGFDLVAQSGQVNLFRLRTGRRHLDRLRLRHAVRGLLAFHDDATGANTVSSTAVTSGWHVVELHVALSSASGASDGTVQVWLDGTLVGALSSQSSVNLGAVPISALQIGDVQAGSAGGVVFDDAAFGTARLGVA